MIGEFFIVTEVLEMFSGMSLIQSLLKILHRYLLYLLDICWMLGMWRFPCES